MSNENDWVRPKKPYTVTPDKTQSGYQGGYDKQPYDKKSYDKKPYNKAKPVVVAAKNNENNKVLHECLRSNGIIKLFINNLLCSDKELMPSYEGKIVRFDDFTILLEGGNGSFLINKSSIAVIEFLKVEG